MVGGSNFKHPLQSSWLILLNFFSNYFRGSSVPRRPVRLNATKIKSLALLDGPGGNTRA